MIRLVWLWLIAFVAGPLAVLVVVAFARPEDGIPPFRPALSLDAIESMLDPLFLDGMLGSLRIASVTSVLCLLIGYPMALGITRSRRPQLWILLLMVPFWSGFLMRLLAWSLMLREAGLLHTEAAMQLGLVSCYLPFLVLPLQARMAQADPRLEQAAADLGAAPWRVFLHVTIPQSLPGIWAGLALVFVPVMGEYVIPELLGDPASRTFGRMIWDAFFAERDWPLAAALSLALLLPAMLLVRR